MKSFKEFILESIWSSSSGVPLYTEIGHNYLNDDNIMWYYDRRVRRIVYHDAGEHDIHHRIFPDNFNDVAYGRIDKERKSISLIVTLDDDILIFDVAHDLKKKYPGYIIFGYGYANREMGVFKG